MIITKPQFWLTLVISIVTALTQLTIGMAQAQTTATAPARPTITGSLENGIAYVIVPTPDPDRQIGSMKVSVSVRAGSLYEADDERGCAFFVAKIIEQKKANPHARERFEDRRLFEFNPVALSWTKLTWSLSQNFNTSTTDFIDNALASVANIANGHLLTTPQVIAAVRQNIKTNSTGHSSINPLVPMESYRGDPSDLALINFVLEGTLLPRRLPYVPESISVTERQIASFVDATFRPDHIVVTLSNILDPQAAEQALKKTLATLVPRGPARPAPSIGEASKPDAPKILCLYNGYPGERGGRFPPVTNITLCMADVIPATITPEYEREQKSLSLATRLLEKRIALLIGDNRHTYGIPKDAAGFFRINRIRYQEGRTDEWQKNFARLVTEIQRVNEYGFTEIELPATTPQSGTIGTQAPITLDECNRAFRNAWRDRAPFIIIDGQENKHTAEEILAVYNAAHDAPATPPDYLKTAPWPYENLGAPCKITSQQHDAATGITNVTFANSVRLVITTLAQNDSVLAQRSTGRSVSDVAEFAVFVGEGRLTEPKTTPGLARLAEVSFAHMPLGKYSNNDLARQFSRKGGADFLRKFKVQADAFVFSNRAVGKDTLSFELQLITARLTDTAYDTTVFNEKKETLMTDYTKSALNIETSPTNSNIALPRFLAGGDTRFGLPTKADIENSTLDEMAAWLRSELPRGPLSIGMRTNMEHNVIIDIVARTLGTLPERTSDTPLDSPLRKIVSPKASSTKNLGYGSSLVSQTYLFWPTTDGMDAHSKSLHVRIANIIKKRLILAGISWPKIAYQASETYPEHGYIVIDTDFDKQKPAIIKIIDSLALNDITQSDLDQDDVDPRLLFGGNQWQPQFIPDVEGLAELRSVPISPQRSDFGFNFKPQKTNTPITLEELNAFAKKYLAPSNRIEVLMK